MKQQVSSSSAFDPEDKGEIFLGNVELFIITAVINSNPEMYPKLGNEKVKEGKMMVEETKQKNVSKRGIVTENIQHTDKTFSLSKL